MPQIRVINASPKWECSPTPMGDARGAGVLHKTHILVDFYGLVVRSKNIRRNSQLKVANVRAIHISRFPISTGGKWTHESYKGRGLPRAIPRCQGRHGVCFVARRSVCHIAALETHCMFCAFGRVVDPPTAEGRRTHFHGCLSPSSSREYLLIAEHRVLLIDLCPLCNVWRACRCMWFRYFVYCGAWHCSCRRTKENHAFDWISPSCGSGFRLTVVWDSIRFHGRARFGSVSRWCRIRFCFIGSVSSSRGIRYHFRV